jgi:hypothetical protein
MGPHEITRDFGVTGRPRSIYIKAAKWKPFLLLKILRVRGLPQVDSRLRERERVVLSKGM